MKRRGFTPKFRPTDMARRVEKLQAAGKMPSLEGLLKAVKTAQSEQQEKRRAKRQRETSLDPQEPMRCRKGQTMTQDNLFELAAFLLANPKSNLSSACATLGLSEDASEGIVRELSPYVERCDRDRHWKKANGRCSQCEMAKLWETGIWQEKFGVFHSRPLNRDDVAFLISVGVWEMPFFGLVYDFDKENGRKPYIGRRLKGEKERVDFLTWLAGKTVRIWLAVCNEANDFWEIEGQPSLKGNARGSGIFPQ